MKAFSTLTLLALIAAASMAGCRAPSAQEKTETPEAVAPGAPTETTETKPATTEPKVAEDERYRATSVTDKDFGPDAKPEMIQSYKKAMELAHQPRPPLDMKVPDKVRVKLDTNRGPITLELDAKAAPLQVKSFVYLAQKGFYDGTIFHRHQALLGGNKGYIIQGGDPLTKDANAIGMAGMGGPGYQVPREQNKLTHQKLVIAAARSQDIDSAGSQFYITQDAVPFLDTEFGGYTVFGKVVDGEDAALKLTKGDTLKSVKVEDMPATAAQPATNEKPEPKN